MCPITTELWVNLYELSARTNYYYCECISIIPNLLQHRHKLEVAEFFFF